MKQTEILKVLAKEFGTNEPAELNKILKAKANEKIRFKLMGESLGYLGLTVAIKNISAEGLKVFDVNRVRLVRFSDLESFEKAKPKVPRPVYTKPKPKPPRIVKGIKAAKAAKAARFNDEDEDDEDFGDSPKKSRRQDRRNFIPKK